MKELLTNPVVFIFAELVVVAVCGVVFKSTSTPKVEKAKNVLNVITDYAEKYVHWAREFQNDKTGEEKMETVCDLLFKIAAEYNIDISKDTIKAIAQTAYDKMVIESPKLIELEPLTDTVCTCGGSCTCDKDKCDCDNEEPDCDFSGDEGIK